MLFSGKNKNTRDYFLHTQMYDKTPDPLLLSVHGTSDIIGIISQDPDIRQNGNRLTVRVESVNGEKVTNESNIIAVTGLFPTYEYGERLEITGVLKSPKNFTDDNTGETFDYITYLQKDRIYFLVYQPKIKIISTNAGDPILSFLFNIKHAFIQSLGTEIPEPNASLLSAMIVGARHLLSDDITTMLRQVGIVHIIILSGYSINIIAESVRRFFSRLPRAYSLSLSALSIILFCLMTGASSIVVRASIMTLILIFSHSQSRSYNVVRAMSVAVFLMILWNPMILVFDSDFQLSCLATFSLIYVAPIFDRKLARFPNPFELKDIFIATISIQALALPYLIYLMGYVSLFALPANILTLPVLPFTMFFGMLSGTLGLVSTILAFPFSVTAYVLSSYELFIGRIFAAIPFSDINIPMPFWLVAIICTIILFFIVRFYRKDRLTINNLSVVSTANRP
ncbi:MAG TPA: ComEC/Rec2 family competence protein [Candidatus Paceibacterota bacterium]|nr:ComEC/Rec2 family competence protein [Candidatus Paceibacterota bacterium]